jgi:hypothetical protein
VKLILPTVSATLAVIVTLSVASALPIASIESNEGVLCDGRRGHHGGRIPPLLPSPLPGQGRRREQPHRHQGRPWRLPPAIREFRMGANIFAKRTASSQFRVQSCPNAVTNATVHECLRKGQAGWPRE